MSDRITPRLGFKEPNLVAEKESGGYAAPAVTEPRYRVGD